MPFWKRRKPTAATVLTEELAKVRGEWAGEVVGIEHDAHVRIHIDQISADALARVIKATAARLPE